MIGIYKIVTGGKVYIGASDNIEKRWEEHKSFAQRYKTDFYKSLKKDLARNAAQFTIITECKVEQFGDLEEYYIDKYDSYFNGWNNTYGANYEGNKWNMPLQKKK